MVKQMKNTILYFTVAAVLFTSTLISAKVTDEQAKQLGQNLTPMGAEKAGNKDKTIPAWDGGITQPIAGYVRGEHHPDPYANEKPLFKIQQNNMDDFSDKLSEGQKALLSKYSSLYFNVYPSHRSTAYPQKVYDAVRKNATTAELDDNGNGVKNSEISIPFPVPSNALEVLWNHILRYRGENLLRKSYSAAVDSKGGFVPVLSEDKVLFNYAQGGETSHELMLAIIQRTLEPTRLAGGITLAKEAVNQAKSPRQAWAYNKGQRRVRRAPTFGYDAYQPGTDGLRTIDEFDMFNGSPDRYDWKLLGKKELYIPFNNYKAHSAEAKIDVLMHERHLNPEYLRYELHRVWVIEATLKEGKRHVYAKRVFFLDEDSWQITIAESYDKRGELWRVAEGLSINYYEKPIQQYVLELNYDLKANRYYVGGMHNGLPPVNFDVSHALKDFRPTVIQRLGVQ